MVWAEVIGDPIAHSKSPAIHRFWLNALGISGDYRATRVPAGSLAEFFAERRADPAWRGCNVTAPHKAAVIPFLDNIADAAGTIGAVNCIVPEGDMLTGYNTDIEGIGKALSGVDFAGRKIVLIGAGGAARAALAYLSNVGADEVTILARDPAKAERGLSGSARICVLPFAMGAEAIGGAGLIINASPLGMDHADAMPEELIAALASTAPGATAFDMVYQPLDTLFLKAARSRDIRTVNGLTMLVGQAGRAFRLFFGATPPCDGTRLQ